MTLAAGDPRLDTLLAHAKALFPNRSEALDAFVLCTAAMMSVCGLGPKQATAHLLRITHLLDAEERGEISGAGVLRLRRKGKPRT